MSGLPDDPFADCRSMGVPGTCNPFSVAKSPWMISQSLPSVPLNPFEHQMSTMHAGPPPSINPFAIMFDHITRLNGKVDLLLVEIMELRRLLSTAPIDPEEG